MCLCVDSTSLWTLLEGGTSLLQKIFPHLVFGWSTHLPKISYRCSVGVGRVILEETTSNGIEMLYLNNFYRFAVTPSPLRGQIDSNHASHMPLTVWQSHQCRGEASGRCRSLGVRHTCTFSLFVKYYSNSKMCRCWRTVLESDHVLRGPCQSPEEELLFCFFTNISH